MFGSEYSVPCLKSGKYQSIDSVAGVDAEDVIQDMRTTMKNRERIANEMISRQEIAMTSAEKKNFRKGEGVEGHMEQVKFDEVQV